jgi:outer membrane lipoprotein-sorting protein
MNTQTSKRTIAALLAALLTAAAPAQSPSPAPRNAAEVIQRINARNASLNSFQARMHVQVHMLSFPWFSPHLDGTAYYKRPANYEVVFEHAPSYMRGFDKLFADIDDPQGWQKDSKIVYSGTRTVGGRSLLTLTMTKKIYSDQIKETIAFVDPATYGIVRMEWHYFKGTITMTQAYRNEGGYNLIASQHVDVQYRVRAVADSSFDPYKTNVPVADSVFTNKN